jgi:hypothetical protein
VMQQLKDERNRFQESYNSTATQLSTLRRERDVSAERRILPSPTLAPSDQQLVREGSRPGGRLLPGSTSSQALTPSTMNPALRPPSLTTMAGSRPQRSELPTFGGNVEQEEYGHGFWSGGHEFRHSTAPDPIIWTQPWQEHEQQPR